MESSRQPSVVWLNKNTSAAMNEDSPQLAKEAAGIIKVMKAVDSVDHTNFLFVKWHILCIQNHIEVYRWLYICRKDLGIVFLKRASSGADLHLSAGRGEMYLRQINTDS